MFQQAIKFECLFVAIFQSFVLICESNFWQLAPPSKQMFQEML